MFVNASSLSFRMFADVHLLERALRTIDTRDASCIDLRANDYCEILIGIVLCVEVGTRFFFDNK